MEEYLHLVQVAIKNQNIVFESGHYGKNVITHLNFISSKIRIMCIKLMT